MTFFLLLFTGIFVGIIKLIEFYLKAIYRLILWLASLVKHKKHSDTVQETTITTSTTFNFDNDKAEGDEDSNEILQFDDLLEIEELLED